MCVLACTEGNDTTSIKTTGESKVMAVHGFISMATRPHEADCLHCLIDKES